MPDKKKTTLTLNGKRVTFSSDVQNVTAFLEQKGYADKKVAIAINGTFIPKSSYDQHKIKDGDEIDIVAPMQGG